MHELQLFSKINLSSFSLSHKKAHPPQWSPFRTFQVPVLVKKHWESKENVGSILFSSIICTAYTACVPSYCQDFLAWFISKIKASLLSSLRQNTSIENFIPSLYADRVCRTGLQQRLSWKWSDKIKQFQQPASPNISIAYKIWNPQASIYCLIYWAETIWM